MSFDQLIVDEKGTVERTVDQLYGFLVTKYSTVLVVLVRFMILKQDERV